MNTYFMFCRPGSIVAEISSTIMDHLFAETVFFARLNSLNLNNLFPGESVFGDIPGFFDVL